MLVAALKEVEKQNVEETQEWIECYNEYNTNTEEKEEETCK